MIAPPYTGNSDLDSFLYNVYINGTGSSGSSSGLNPNTTTGEITDSEGNVIGYLYQFIHVKYADNNTGLNISNLPIGKAYYGIHNSASSTESTNPADYTWYEVPGTFGTTRQLYYCVLGGRQIKFDVNTNPIDYKWIVDSGAAISLDNIIPEKTISSNELLDQAVTELKLADAAVTASKTNISAISNITGELVANSVGNTQITDNAITSEKITANAIIAGKIAANAVTTVNIEAGAITAESAIIANSAILSANIKDLTVQRIKIADGAVSDKAYASTGLVSLNDTNYTSLISVTVPAIQNVPMFCEAQILYRPGDSFSGPLNTGEIHTLNAYVTTIASQVRTNVITRAPGLGLWYSGTNTLNILDNYTPTSSGNVTYNLMVRGIRTNDGVIIDYKSWIFFAQLRIYTLAK